MLTPGTQRRTVRPAYRYLHKPQHNSELHNSFQHRYKPERLVEVHSNATNMLLAVSFSLKLNRGELSGRKL